MKFCENCGSELHDKDKFCPVCGCKVNQKENSNHITYNSRYIDAEEETDDDFDEDMDDSYDDNYEDEVIYKYNIAESEDDQYESGRMARKKYSDKKSSSGSTVAIVILVILLSILVLGFAGIFIHNWYNTEERAVEKFNEYVEAKDYKKLSKMIVCDDTSIVIDESSLTPMVDFLTSDKENLKTASDQLRYSVKNGERDDMLFQLVPEVRYKVLKTYKVDVQAVPITINFSVSGISLLQDKKEITVSTEDNMAVHLNNVLPGSYYYTAVISNDFITRTDAYKLDAIDIKNNELSVFPKLYKIKIISQMPNGTIYINGRDTGIAADGIVEAGPFDENVNVQAISESDYSSMVLATKDNNIIVLVSERNNNASYYSSTSNNSTTVTVNNDGSYYIGEDAAKQLVEYSLVGYLSCVDDAVNNNDFYAIAQYIYDGSEMYSMQQSFVPEAYSRGVKESFLDYDITSIRFNNNSHTEGVVTTNESYNITMDGETTVKYYSWHYEFKFNEQYSKYQFTKMYK